VQLLPDAVLHSFPDPAVRADPEILHAVARCRQPPFQIRQKPGDERHRGPACAIDAAGHRLAAEARLRHHVAQGVHVEGKERPKDAVAAVRPGAPALLADEDIRLPREALEQEGNLEKEPALVFLQVNIENLEIFHGPKRLLQGRRPFADHPAAPGRGLPQNARQAGLQARGQERFFAGSFQGLL